MENYQIINSSISCKDGILTINHSLDENVNKIDIKVDPFIIKFLNDEEYLENLEVAASEYENEIQNCLDLSPFPYAGFLMLKEKRVKNSLWCSSKCEELVRTLAQKNCIKIEQINFMDELMDIADVRFDVIILNPFQELGDIDNEVVSNYVIYKELLTPNGLLIPHKITVHGELINSEWLLKCCKITNEKIKDLKIDKYMNKYATQVHFDLDATVNCQRLTNEYKIGEIIWDENYHESSIKPFIRNTSLPIDFILLYFKIYLTRSSEDFSIYRRNKNCCFRKFAQTLDADNIVDSSNVKIKFVQNCGLFKIYCE